MTIDHEKMKKLVKIKSNGFEVETKGFQELFELGIEELLESSIEIGITAVIATLMLALRS